MTMRHQTPPLQAIQAFIIAVDAPSFRAGAEALSLSPSAFSRRIETLERYLGVNLFDRTGARPILTDLGHTYYRRIQPAVDAICRATLETGERQSEALRVQFPQSLAMSWLLPQLSGLSTVLGSSGTVTLSVGRDLGNVYAGDCDVGVFSAPREFHGLPVEALVELEAGVVCAETLADHRAPPATASSLKEHTLFAPSQPPDVWPRWLELAGQDGTCAKRQHYDTIAMSYEAVAAGLGLGLGLPLHVDRYLRERRLRFCLPDCHATGYSYVLVFSSERVRRRPDARRFAEWLHMATERSNERFQEALAAAA
jgi:DNA-binding transcriptional LysR family regulator